MGIFSENWYYCKSCGRKFQEDNIIKCIFNNLKSDDERMTCEYCKGTVIRLPNEVAYKYKSKKSDDFIDYISQKIVLEKRFIEDYVSKNPEFNQQEADNNIQGLIEWKQRVEQNDIRRKQERDEASNKYWAERVAKEKAKHPECPYCHSTHTHKISTAGRVVDTAIFGIASDTIGENFQCDNCGVTF